MVSLKFREETEAPITRLHKRKSLVAMNIGSISAFILAAGTLTACKDDNGWTQDRRDWIRSRCINTSSAAVCDCALKEVTSTVPYKDFASNPTNNSFTNFEVTAIGLCRSKHGE